MTSKTLLLFVAIAILFGSTRAHLEFNFYEETNCTRAEDIVFEQVKKIVARDPTLAASFLRLHFLDCFVNGCDASILLKSSNGSIAERDAAINKNLRGLKEIDLIKAKAEKECPGIVSCADIIALAARDSVYLSQGVRFPIQTGRRDGNRSLASDIAGNLPPPTSRIADLKAFFLQKNLTVKDLVVLSGAHTIGRSHCSSFANRLYNFSAYSTTDPSLDSKYAAELKKICKPKGPDRVVVMDPTSPGKFDLGYYKILSKNKGLFTSDEALLHDPDTKGYLQRQAKAQSKAEFFADFSQSMVNMGKIGVLTHQKGEIRKKCAYII